MTLLSVKRIALLAVVIVAFPAIASLSQRRALSSDQPPRYPAPPLRALGGIAALVAEIAPAGDADIASLRRWNASGAPPAKVGLVRAIEPVNVSSGPVASSLGAVRWRGSIRARGASRVRLKLTNLSLPPKSVLWIYAPGEEPRGFDASLIHDGELWTPSVAGDTATLEIEAPTAFRFTVSHVADLRSRHEVSSESAGCFRDAACHSAKGAADSASAVALYEVITPDGIAQCSGGLIIDRQQSFKPYFLTAHHCVSTASEAATLEAFWDYRASACDGPAPSLSTRPRTIGAILLTTSAPHDMTLLRLASVPGPRVWLGWRADVIPGGTELYRISHPEGEPQRFETLVVRDGSKTLCEFWQRPDFLYSAPSLGKPGNGSSGAPLLTRDGAIVGQLSGVCGRLSGDPCEDNEDVDGALSGSFPLLQPFIDPPASEDCDVCTPGPNVACLLGGRFKVEMRWRNQFATPATSGTGSVIRYAENKPEIHPTLGPLSETAYFQMFQPARVEVVVKMLSGTGINNMFWVFATGLTNNEYWVTVTDTKSCATWERYNEHGQFSNLTDFEAFPLP